MDRNHLCGKIESGSQRYLPKPPRRQCDNQLCLASGLKPGDSLRRSLLTSREEQLKNLYDILSAITAQAKQNRDNPNPKDADLIIKYTAAIKNLETDIGVGEIIDVIKPFVVWLMKKDLEMAKKLTGYFDQYIKEKLKTF